MRIVGAKQAKRLARWVKGRLVSGALILGYHRIAEGPHDPYGICVSPGHFAEQLQALHRLCRPTGLPQLIQDLRQERPLDRTVVLTFDDGYDDTLKVVKPLLERYEIPATIFVATGYVGAEFWWDTLQRLLFSPAALPRQLSLPLGGRPFHWAANDEGARTSDGSARKQLLLSLYHRLLPLSPAERTEAFARLHAWTGVQPDGRPDCRALSEKELVDLASTPLVEIGAHTQTHPLLPTLPLPAQRSEIMESKTYLASLLRRPVTLFSYPNGARSAATEQLVRESGFAGACGSSNGVAWRSSSLFCLPRFWVPNHHGERFARWLQRWL